LTRVASKASGGTINNRIIDCQNFTCCTPCALSGASKYFCFLKPVSFATRFVGKLCASEL